MCACVCVLDILSNHEDMYKFVKFKQGVGKGRKLLFRKAV